MIHLELLRIGKLILPNIVMSLSCLYQNVRALNSKCHLFHNNCLSSSFDIIIISKTWLNESVKNSELFPSYYNVIRSDRNFSLINRSKCGGVLISLISNISYTTIDLSNIIYLTPIIDITACQCYFDNLSFIICAIYIPPDIIVDDLHTFFEALEIVFLDKRVLIFGDFNMPHLYDESYNCSKSDICRNFMNSLNLVQYNNVLNCKSNRLDLVFTNFLHSISVDHSDFPLVPEDSYHPSLSINFNVVSNPINVNFPLASKTRYNFRRANFTQLYNDLCDIDWSSLNSIINVDTAVNKFYNILYSSFDKSVPQSTYSTSHYPPWFTKQIKYNLKTKEYFRKKWIKYSKMHYLIEFKRLRLLIKSQINEAYNSYITSVENNIKSNPPDFWKFAQIKQGTSRIPSKLRNSELVELNSPQDIVNAFASSFSEYFSASSSYNNTTKKFSNHSSFKLNLVTEDDIINILSTFKTKCTAGEDMVPSFLVKDACFILCKPLTLIINLCITSCTFPERWKRTRIIPIFKKGDKLNIQNYRPISILNNFAKVLEIVIYTSLYRNTSRIISVKQHGFMKGRSTTTNLASFSQCVAEMLDERSQIDVIYTDFSHAFDFVDHGILLSKISFYGACPDLVTLLNSYLNNRVCYVYYNGFSSFEFIATSGVPQGSNLGPLLFNLYINELLTLFSCYTLAYADDLKIFAKINSIHDAQLLQNNIYILIDWCEINKLRLNVTKCCKMSFTRKLGTISFPYVMCGSTLRNVTSFKDLGVTFTSNFIFSDHINNTVREANKMLKKIKNIITLGLVSQEKCLTLL